MCPFEFVDCVIANLLPAQVCLGDVSILALHADCRMSDWQTQVQPKHVLWSYFHHPDISPIHPSC
jgi:hypothetical protein